MTIAEQQGGKRLLLGAWLVIDQSTTLPGRQIIVVMLLSGLTDTKEKRISCWSENGREGTHRRLGIWQEPLEAPIEPTTAEI